MVSPGGCIGLLGGGQLGRMTGIAARRMGYSVRVFEPNKNAPAGQIADEAFNAPYEDLSALEAFAQKTDVITLEFENIPAESVKKLGSMRPVHPGWEVLNICQNRQREKEFLRDNGFPHAGFVVVRSEQEVEEAIRHLGGDGVLKTADFGYDGKGQTRLSGANPASQAREAWNELGAPVGVVEEWVDFHCELSVICARNETGEVRMFPPAENIHTDHILDYSLVPARTSPRVLAEAEELAGTLAETLDVVGLLAVEMFLGVSEELMVNELAPRPHNSGSTLR